MCCATQQGQVAQELIAVEKVLLKIFNGGKTQFDVI